MYIENEEHLVATDRLVGEDEHAPFFGPQTASEAIDRLKIAEGQFDAGQYTHGSEFFTQTRNLISQYAVEGF